MMETVMSKADYRPLTDAERSMVTKMLSIDVPGIEILREQARVATAKVIDEYGSISFKIDADSRSQFTDGPLISATQADKNTVCGYGPYINIILFIKLGMLNELQIYKDDGSPILERVDPSKFELVVDRRKI
jgi:hypothetical protein